MLVEKNVIQVVFCVKDSSVTNKMPETIKTGNVTSTGDVDENRGKDFDNVDRIPELPLACWKGHESRVTLCRERFRNRFNSAPTFYVRVPGRYTQHKDETSFFEKLFHFCYKYTHSIILLPYNNYCLKRSETFLMIFHQSS